MTQTPPNEVLGRYLDGEATPAERSALEAEIARQPAMAVELAELRALDRSFKRAYGDVLEEPLDPAIEGRIAAALARARGEQEVAAQEPPPVPRYAWSARSVGLAVAASLVALMLAGLVGYRLAERHFEAELVSAQALTAQDRQLAAAALEEALDRTLSGTAVGWHNEASGSSGEVTPIRTFRNFDDRWCREYEARTMVREQIDVRRAIACREDSGIWRTRLVSESDI